MNASAAGVSWVRVLVGAVAAYVLHGLLVVLAVLASTIPGILSDGPNQESIDGLAGLIGIWGLPMLALASAAWAARGTVTPTLNGLLVGLVAALGPFFGLLGPPSLLVAAITVAAGLLGGLAGWPLRRGATP